MILCPFHAARADYPLPARVNHPHPDQLHVVPKSLNWEQVSV